ncbi:alpha/beta hydrolase [Acetanaerobacterium elongatum]|uniref:Alpha/beta hydrolase family protein n=1 Tax=Acetanaerobacterium elongatum TaxID=258515 RepID=A0A1H0D3A1_9FIRM|nr:alpha/beta hydrolase [Acetanaerobacterium elongatum]SDN64361.1 Alpha/beta hydrolase family protein [Acetanaerobacterium elongatum]
MKTKGKTKIGLKLAIGFTVLLLAVTGAFSIYISDYYHADATAVKAASMATDVDISNLNGALLFDPGNADTAMIFYPGGKVEYTAYKPLMIKIAQKGILCILPQMPFNLAVFDESAADKYISAYPNVQHWYVGGHSLGGSMAASYASKSNGRVEGLVLLAAYSPVDISSGGLRVLSLYGSKDGVLNRKSYLKNKVNLPANLTETVLQGGNHAGFGCYGPQQGDGKADITSEQQQTDTAQAIAEFCLAAKNH